MHLEQQEKLLQVKCTAIARMVLRNALYVYIRAGHMLLYSTYIMKKYTYCLHVVMVIMKKTGWLNRISQHLLCIRATCYMSGCKNSILVTFSFISDYKNCLFTYSKS